MVFVGCAVGPPKIKVQMVALEEIETAEASASV